MMPLHCAAMAATVAHTVCPMQMLIVSRLSVLTFALFAGVWSIALIHIGININWLFFVIGLLVASVFPPISFLLTWNAVPKVHSPLPPC